MSQKCNPAGIRIIQLHEGCELEAYPDPGSELGKACAAGCLAMRNFRNITNWRNLAGAPWTIGWGHTGPEVHPTLFWTRAQVDAVFYSDLHFRAEAPIARLVKMPPTDNQFSAVCSFVFNIGQGAFATHDMLRYLNEGDFSKAAAEFPLWNKSGGVVLPGLISRREAERELFLRG